MKPKKINFKKHSLFEGYELGFITGASVFPAYEIQKIGTRKPLYTVMFLASGIGIAHGARKIKDKIKTIEKAREIAQQHFDKFVTSLCE